VSEAYEGDSERGKFPSYEGATVPLVLFSQGVMSGQELAGQEHHGGSYVFGDGGGIGVGGGIEQQASFSEGFYLDVFGAGAGPNERLEVRRLGQKRLIYGYSPA